MPGIFPPEFGNLTRLLEMYVYHFTHITISVSRVSETWNSSNLSLCFFSFLFFFLTEIFLGTISMEQYLRPCLEPHLKSCNNALNLCSVLCSCDDKVVLILVLLNKQVCNRKPSLWTNSSSTWRRYYTY